MAVAKPKSSSPAAEVQGAAKLLGGRSVLRHTPRTPMDVHLVISRGLPAQALVRLIENLVVLQADNALEKALGMSLRTMQRRTSAPARQLTPEQSGRTWKFAETLAKATQAFGSQKDAEEWMERPAMGLDRQRPIDLLATPKGTEIVETFLDRINHGVYA
ncbi:MAG: antitoxin Xre/MbcA/ParS toxin-binding domain-containing protein [Parvibaculaceae bacterium]